MLSFGEKYCLDQLKALLAIDSTTGQYEEIERYMLDQCEKLGFKACTCRKGGVIADLGGEGDPIVVTAHLDDIGLMVRKINPDGTLNVCTVGGLPPQYAVTENVRVHTRDGKVYTGTVCRAPGSVHVTEEEFRTTLPDYRKNVCIVLDEPVKNAGDTRALGIETGDIIALDTRFTMSNGYIKSRFVDDKACVAVVLTFMKYLKDTGKNPCRKVYAYFAAYEEIGHGTSWIPEDTKDILALDIAPTGPDQNSEEHKVSIFAKDTSYPFHWAMTNELRKVAKDEGLNWVMDVFTPHYGTDAETSIRAGYDIRHAAIGPGTSNSHGYERTHIDGLKNTYCLMAAYLLG
ncbi:MAG: M42 family metallopeptidase [Firmicutes bacterium]|nr:M42 family metallopeptidase [Bacillota bacterium]